MKPDVKERVSVLYEVGFTRTMLARTVARWPLLLTCPPSVIFLVSGYLSSQAVGFKARDLGNLYQFAPWLLHIATPERLEPLLEILRKDGVKALSRVVRGHPQLIMLSSDDLQERMDLLKSLVPGEGVARMVEAVPQLLGLDPEEQIMPMVRYLQDDLGLPKDDFIKVLRAFPALLSLNVEEDVLPVARFLSDEVGIRDVAKFVARLPPVLGYKLEEDLRPKYHYFHDRLGLGAKELSRFPGYFAHPLEKRTMPRVEFLLEKGLPLREWGMKDGKWLDSPYALLSVGTLKRALTFGDREFAEELSGEPLDDWIAFRDGYVKKMKAGESGSSLRGSSSSVVGVVVRESSSGGGSSRSGSGGGPPPPAATTG